MNSIRIQEVSWDDAVHRQAVVNLIDAYAREPLEGGRGLSTFARDNVVSGLHEHQTSLVLLAFSGTDAVGIAVCFRGFSTFSARPLINIHDLAVLREWQGLGVGSALLNAVADRAAQEGCCKVTLEVRSDNPGARRLYERQGYGPPGGKPTLFFDRPIGQS